MKIAAAISGTGAKRIATWMGSDKPRPGDQALPRSGRLPRISCGPAGVGAAAGFVAFAVAGSAAAAALAGCDGSAPVTVSGVATVLRVWYFSFSGSKYVNEKTG